MTGIIVDDEARSRRILEAFCNEYCPGLQIIGMTDSVSEARTILRQSTPDIVFLDIEMPLEDGFALLQEEYENPPFEVIFTTAFEQYALQAFQVDAIDYLLKPIQIEELIKAVERVKARLNKGDNNSKAQFIQRLIENKVLDKLALTTMDGHTFVNPAQIVRCEAHGNYTYVHFMDGSFLLLTKTLRHYDDLLSQYKFFFRVHKKHLVNLFFVRQFMKGKQAELEMKDASRVQVSERKRKALLSALNKQE